MKITYSLLLMFGFLTSSVGQQTDLANFTNTPWLFILRESGEQQQNVITRYQFIYKENQEGILSVVLTFATDGEDLIQYFGVTKFSYELAEAETNTTAQLEINFDDLNLTLAPNSFRRAINVHNEDVVRQLNKDFSNNTVTYAISRTGSNLVVEGFAQNTQSSFTYFCNNPLNATEDF